ncbi:MAG: asparagine synthase-related protein [Rhodospirillales bacterium]
MQAASPRSMIRCWRCSRRIWRGTLPTTSGEVDRASMAVALEVRCPLLDWRILEFALSLPASMKLGAAGGKRILRALLGRHVPQAPLGPAEGRLQRADRSLAARPAARLGRGAAG